MVNAAKRQIAATLVEQLLTREITNDQFNDSFPQDSADPALRAICANIWPYYSDTATHRLEGQHALTPEARRLFLRCIAFLRSGLNYEWPDYAWISPLYLFMRIVGLVKKIDAQFETFKQAGDFEVWPFIRSVDLLASNPPQ